MAGIVTKLKELEKRAREVSSEEQELEVLGELEEYIEECEEISEQVERILELLTEETELPVHLELIKGSSQKITKLGRRPFAKLRTSSCRLLRSLSKEDEYKKRDRMQGKDSYQVIGKECKKQRAWGIVHRIKTGGRKKKHDTGCKKHRAWSRGQRAWGIELKQGLGKQINTKVTRRLAL